ncbi:MAG: cysteine-rich CWC family protein [Rubrivivax sp.]
MRINVAGPLANAACARCGGAFHCGAADPDPCACSALLLSATLQVALRERWRGCLCLDCLRALAAQDTAGESPAAGGTRDPTPG